MTTNIQGFQGSNILDTLKKKMRATKDECEKYKEEAEDLQRKLNDEINRREEGETEVASLNRKIQLLEEDLERSEERGQNAAQKLAEATNAADESERARKVLENKTSTEEDHVAIVEQQLAQVGIAIEMEEAFC